MSIVLHDQTFTLNTKNTTYMMQVDEFGYLLHLYYGKRADLPPHYLLVKKDRGFSGNPYDAQKDRTYSLDVLPQEFPFDGSGDYRTTSLSLRNQEGVYGCDLRFKKAEVIQGKTPLRGLPAMSDQNVESLEITLEDSFLQLEVILAYSVYADVDIITRSVCLVNHGDTITIENIQSANLDFVSGNFDLITFYGRHAMERVPNRKEITHGLYEINSKRGTSSHQYNPAMILCDHNATETTGSAYSMNFVYSGNFEAKVEADQYGQKRMMMGLSREYFSYPVEKGETFYAPEVMMSYSSEGLARLSQNLHQGMKKYLIRDPQPGLKPILINSWEAAYFDFNGDTIYALAKAAKECDIDMVVMDDGWFGHRQSDNAALGDWYVNEEKLGESLASLSARIHDLGLKFGIWFEPECISEDSDLYRNHPDYAIKVPNRKYVRSREQLVLDFSRKEVVDAIFNQVCDILDHAAIDYVKWDFNRSICDIYSVQTSSQGKVMYDYVLGLYDFLERLIARYPKLLIEGCSGGGGRFDAGMLHYTPQIWLSDNTDAIDRLIIQYGSSYIYPISSFGSHVSAVPNHQTGRITPMSTRATVAMSGTFGYELDITKCDDKEKQTIREQVATFKKYASLIHNGRYYRLTNPVHDEVGAYSFVSDDYKEALICAVRIITHASRYAHFIKIKGLEENAFYQDDQGQIYDANVLKTQGLPLVVDLGEYQAYTIHLTKVEGEK